jgi:hypothetical protein
MGERKFCPNCGEELRNVNNKRTLDGRGVDRGFCAREDRSRDAKTRLWNLTLGIFLRRIGWLREEPRYAEKR